MKPKLQEKIFGGDKVFGSNNYHVIILPAIMLLAVGTVASGGVLLPAWPMFGVIWFIGLVIAMLCFFTVILAPVGFVAL
jgi:hypothetical protein